MIRYRILRGLALLVLAVSFRPPMAMAQQIPTAIIRDTEIESILKKWCEPLFHAAGMNSDSVKIVLVQDPQINAFVAGGANIFIFTGLIEKTRNPGELIGVIAHELGHISGGHLVRTHQAMENASYEAMLGAALGIGAAILTGDGGAAAAVSAGAQSQAMGRFMAFSRAQESSADQAALNFMSQAHMDPKGFQTFMEQMESQELLPASQQSEYVRTHPLTRDRIELIENSVKTSSYAGQAFPAGWNEEHARFLAKLNAFISPEKVSWVYDDQDQGLPARYARAIAAYRENRVDEALKLTDGLLKDEPDNPYFYELKGQMLMEFGRVGEARTFLRRAVELKPDAPLIRVLYAHALIENSGNGQKSTDVAEAISQLERALRDEPRSPRVHRLLATAHGYQGREAEAKLHLAEEAVLQQRFDDAGRLAEAAAAQLKQGSQSWLRAQDILAYIKQAKPKDSRDRG